MKMLTKRAILVSTLGGFGTLTGVVHAQTPPPLPADETNAIVVLDKSGSMVADFEVDSSGSTVKTMWDVSKERAIEYLTQPAMNREYAFWTYNGTSYTEVYSFADGVSGPTIASQIAAGDFDRPSSTTPLAMSVCAAADVLSAYEANKPVIIDRVIQLFTDGLENSTPSTDQCYGPSSTTDVYPNYDTGSWQKKMLNKLQTGDPNTPGAGPFDHIVNIEKVFQYIVPTMSMSSFSLSAALGTASDTAAPQGSNAFAPLATTNASMFSFDGDQFYADIASASGGEYLQLDPNQPGGVQLPQPGDVDSNFCVDYADYNEVMQWYGQTVTPNHPMTYLADLNNDRVINYYDYLMVVQNWNEGCVN